MGHYCWMCERLRPNERFSGGGHKRHLCKDCQKLPANMRLVKQATRDLWGYLRQRNISPGNMRRLQTILSTPALQELFPLARVILQIAEVKPHRRKRLSFIMWNHPDLWKEMIAVGIVESYAEAAPEDGDEFHGFECWPEESESFGEYDSSQKADSVPILDANEDDSIPF